MSHTFDPNKIASNLKFEVGEVTLDGSGATSVDFSGKFRVILGAVATIEKSSTPGDATSVVTFAINGTSIDFYPWKNTGGTDPTLVASDGTEDVHYIVWGTP